MSKTAKIERFDARIEETGDFNRFAKGNVYAAYPGLVPGERRGKLTYPLKNNIKLTNTCALIIQDFPNGVEIIGE